MPKHESDPPTLEPSEVVQFGDAIPAADDLSAVRVIGPWLLVGSDETRGLAVLRREGDVYHRHHQWQLVAPGEGPQEDDDSDDELDIEGLATDGKYVYVAGSHAAVRDKVEPDVTYHKNRRTLDDVDQEPNRDTLVRTTFDPETGELGERETLSLHKMLKRHPVLKRFRKIPSKENGIDIEGIAATMGWLYLGFRGPVLRGNYVPVLRFRFDKPKRVQTLYLNLGGRGVRDMAVVDDGLLLIGGAVGDAALSFELYHWDGQDCLAGRRAPGDPPQGTITRLGTLPQLDGGSPEGLAVLDTTDEAWTVLVVHDGPVGGRPVIYRVERPGS